MSQDISQQKDWLSAWRTFYEPEKSLEKVDPNAISISSVDSDGMPNNRIVLLKDVNEDGFIFYTNYQSQKGKELFANGKGAITWWSRAQHKSVRVQGLVSKVDNKTSDDYFASRSREAQISASVSKQSEVLESREKLIKEWNDFEKEHEGKRINRPEHWGGICLNPTRVEFWESVDNYSDRLHERIVFRLDGSNWLKERLYP
jgi:pyridoxamine 5'-phosphate oxidase